jgi:NAD-reducing hydrogenase large subunit
MIEMLHAAEVIKELLHDDRPAPAMIWSPAANAGNAASASSKRRVARLIHHYRVDEQRSGHPCQPDRLHHAQQPGDERRRYGEVARSNTSMDARLTEGLLNHIEVAVRAFDPVPVVRHARSGARCRLKSR